MPVLNGFEKQGLKHTSASQINMYASAPCAWTAKYLYGHKFKFGVAAQVGVLVEKVVENTLFGMPFEKALEQAHKTFEKNNALNLNEKDLKRRDDIESMSAIALEVLEPYGMPEMQEGLMGREQQKVTLLCKGWGWELPIIGYLDFVYPHLNLVVDLKTTRRIPSVMSSSHKRQAAIYEKAKGFDVEFLYVSPKKYITHRNDNVDGTLAEIKQILKRQEMMLRLDKETIKDVTPVVQDSFYWAGEQNARIELYGI